MCEDFANAIHGRANATDAIKSRIRWKFTANESAADSVHVLRDVTDANSGLVPFFNEDGTMHRVGAASITCEPVSSIIVTINDIINLGYMDDYREEGYVSPEEDDDDDEEEKEEREPKFGWLRFYRGPRLEVKPKSADFVTIGDYITAVHPWLHDKRQLILTAMGIEYGGRKLPDNTEFWVQHKVPCSIQLRITEGDIAKRWQLEGGH